jgi:hypothetical protein
MNRTQMKHVSPTITTSGKQPLVSWLGAEAEKAARRPHVNSRLPFLLAGVFLILFALFWATGLIHAPWHPVIAQCVCASLGAFAVVLSLIGRK